MTLAANKGRAAKGGAHASLMHDSALKHLTGQALYADDIPEPDGMLHAALVISPIASGKLRGIHTAAAAAMPGIVRVFTAADIPGQNDVGPVGKNEPLFATDEVLFAGQPVAAVLAVTFDQARAAAKAVTLDIEESVPILTIADAMEKQSLLASPMHLTRGDVDAALRSAPLQLSGKFSAGGQEHFYLEGQIAIATTGEDGDLSVQSSTQHPTEVQHICARLLGCSHNQISVIVRRLGGGFGGKESNASWVAGLAALLARTSSRPVKVRLPRHIDMISTGKRHGIEVSYTVGFDKSGKVQGLDVVLAANGGATLDLTGGVLTRALTHIDNCYWIPHFRAVGYPCKTNTVSNTAFRGFGGPQGVLVMEHAIDRIAHHLRMSTEAVRAANYYGANGNGEETPYEQPIQDNLIEPCVRQVMQDSDWSRRRTEINSFNNASPVIKRGLGLFPIKFGIAFNAQHLNQAGALIHIYSDGSIRLNHGGTEMGQGLFIKIAQVVAEVFKVDIDTVRITATSTAEVPNTSPTAASTGSDLNGWAAYNAAFAIKRRMTQFAAAHFEVKEDEVIFDDNHVHIGAPGVNQVLTFGEFARLCWMNRISLSSTGFYRIPDVHWDPKSMKGSPFFYFVYGAAAVEVSIDCLTGETQVLRADLVEDCGRSLNPLIDIGQIEGGFVQGQGWFLCEELWWNKSGVLRTSGPSTYKIPGSRDVPPIFNVAILRDAPARADTVFRSKGVGEPPLMLATAIWTAVKDAIGSVADHRFAIDLDVPATPERILKAVKETKARMVAERHSSEL